MGDPRKVPSAIVRATVAVVLGEKASRRRYGTKYKETWVRGEVIDIIVEKKHKKSVTKLFVRWDVNNEKLEKVVNLRSTMLVRRAGCEEDEKEKSPLRQASNESVDSREGGDRTRMSDRVEERAVAEQYTSLGGAETRKVAGEGKVSKQYLRTGVRDSMQEGDGRMLESGEAAVATGKGSLVVTVRRPGIEPSKCTGDPPGDGREVKLSDAIAHGVHWNEMQVGDCLNGPVRKRQWKVYGPGKVDCIVEGQEYRERPLLDYFLWMFPLEHLNVITTLTSINLERRGRKGTTPGEILKFFGVLVLLTRFEFSRRRDLWRTTSRTQYIPAACFGKAMARDRFEKICSNLQFSREAGIEGSLERILLFDGKRKHLQRQTWNGSSMVRP